MKHDEKDGLAVEAKWFNHFPIYDDKDVPTDFVTYDRPQCINYLFLTVEPKEHDQLENNPSTTSFSQEIKKYDENDNVAQGDFLNHILEVDDKSNIGLSNKLSPYTMLIGAFKEMTSHLGGYCIMEEINDIRLYFTNKVAKCKKSTKNVERNSQSGKAFNYFCDTTIFKKESTSHLEGYCTMEEMNKIRLIFFINKITAYRRHKI